MKTSFAHAAIDKLSRHLQIDSAFLQQCLQESVIEIEETEEQLDLTNGTTLRLRRLQRICETMNVDLPVAMLVCELLGRISELERQLKTAG